MFRFVFIIIIILHPFRLYATDLLVAGFALSGEYSNNIKNYKYTSELIEKNPSKFNKVIRENIIGNNYGHNFIFDFEDDAEKTAIAFTLARENLNISKTREGLYRAKIRSLGQIMIFNNRDQIIDAIYSFPITFTKIYSNRPTELEILNLFDDFYFGQDNFEVKKVDEKGTTKCNESLSFTNYFDYMLMQIPCVSIKDSYSQRIKVKNININKNIESLLDNSEMTQKSFKQEIGLTVTSMLSTELKIPILPYIADGQDIYQIKTRFSDSSEKILRIPDSDFDIDIDIKAFNKKQTASDNIEEQWLYAFQSHFKFFEPLSDTIYFEDTLIGYQYKKFPIKYVSNKNDLQIYLEVINYFYRDLALSFDAINNTEKVKKKVFSKKDDGDMFSNTNSGFNWSKSSVLKDWYKTRSKLKYSQIKSMLAETKEKIEQCR